MVWSGFDGSDSEIFLYDGSTTTNLSNNNYSDGNPQINSNGHVVWEGAPGPNAVIFLYDGSRITQLSDSNYKSVHPQINSKGHVVWRTHDGVDWEIFLYDGSTTTQLSNNHYDDHYPEINDNGYVVWASDNPNLNYTPIYVYNGLATVEAAKNYSPIGNSAQNPKININGQVVWAGHKSLELTTDTTLEIFLATLSDKKDVPDKKDVALGTMPWIPLLLLDD